MSNYTSSLLTVLSPKADTLGMNDQNNMYWESVSDCTYKAKLQLHAFNPGTILRANVPDWDLATVANFELQVEVDACKDDNDLWWGIPVIGVCVFITAVILIVIIIRFCKKSEPEPETQTLVADKETSESQPING